MRYQVIFEYQTQGSAMSDVYNCKDEPSARAKFGELRDELYFIIDPTCCEVTNEPDYYCVINRDEGIYGYVRLLAL